MVVAPKATQETFDSEISAKQLYVAAAERLSLITLVTIGSVVVAQGTSD